MGEPMKYPIEAIEKMLWAHMNQAVANGANSISMPDEYVEIAWWLANLPRDQEKDTPCNTK